MAIRVLVSDAGMATEARMLDSPFFTTRPLGFPRRLCIHQPRGVAGGAGASAEGALAESKGPFVRCCAGFRLALYLNPDPEVPRGL